MKKTFLTFMLLSVMISVLSGCKEEIKTEVLTEINTEETVEIKTDEIIRIKKEGIEAYKSEQKINSEVVVVYDFSHFLSELYAENGKTSIGSIFNKAEKNGMKKYLTDAQTGSIYDGIYQTIVKSEKKINFKGKEYEVLDSLYFCSGEHGILATVHLTNDQAMIDLGENGIYTWEEHTEIFGHFMEYGKPLYAWPPYYFEYFTAVFPFLNLENELEASGKETKINSTSDIENLEKDLLEGFEKNFKGSSLSDANTVITYSGLFESTEKDIYSIVENSVKNGNFNFVEYNPEDGFKVSSAYKTYEQIFDRVYLLPSIKHFESYKNTFELGDKEYIIREKVYFHDVTYGFICILITDENVFAATYNPYKEEPSVYKLDELERLEECYLKYKEAYSVYQGSFCMYISGVHKKMSEYDHEVVEGKLQKDKENTDSLEVSETIKKEFGISSNAVVISSMNGSLTNPFAQKATISDISGYGMGSFYQRYYVIESDASLYQITITNEQKTFKKEITGVPKEAFMKVYTYVTNPDRLFKEKITVNKVYFLEETDHLIVYFVTDKGDYILYYPSYTWHKLEEHSIYLMPLAHFQEAAGKKSLEILSLEIAGEGESGEVTKYIDRSKYLVIS